MLLACHCCGRCCEVCSWVEDHVLHLEFRFSVPTLLFAYAYVCLLCLCELFFTGASQHHIAGRVQKFFPLESCRCCIVSADVGDVSTVDCDNGNCGVSRECASMSFRQPLDSWISLPFKWKTLV